MADVMPLPRVITNELLHCRTRTPSLRGEVLGTNATGPVVVRVGTIQLIRVSSDYCPKRDQLAFRSPESTVLCANVGHQPNAMEDPTAARGARAHGADGVHSASEGNPKVRWRPGRWPAEAGNKWDDRGR